LRPVPSAIPLLFERGPLDRQLQPAAGPRVDGRCEYRLDGLAAREASDAGGRGPLAADHQGDQQADQEMA
jgi:hypothetical protein